MADEQSSHDIRDETSDPLDQTYSDFISCLHELADETSCRFSFEEYLKEIKPPLYVPLSAVALKWHIIKQTYHNLSPSDQMRQHGTKEFDSCLARIDILWVELINEYMHLQTCQDDFIKDDDH